LAIIGALDAKLLNSPYNNFFAVSDKTNRRAGRQAAAK
jgi:hypothetical protein